MGIKEEIKHNLKKYIYKTETMVVDDITILSQIKKENENEICNLISYNKTLAHVIKERKKLLKEIRGER